MASPSSSTVLQWARGLRFPTLFMVTAGLFMVSLLVPDPIPFVDELLFGLVTLMLANWKRRKGGNDLGASASGQSPVVADHPPRQGGGAAPPPPGDDGRR